MQQNIQKKNLPAKFTPIKKNTTKSTHFTNEKKTGQSVFYNKNKI